MVGDAGLGLQAQLAQVLGHLGRRALLAVGQLGVLMEVAAPGPDIGLQALDGRLDFGAGLRGQGLHRQRGDEQGSG